MSPTAQIIVASGIAGLLLLLGCLGIIWAIRCDPRKPHYRLPVVATLIAPIAAIILALLKAR